LTVDSDPRALARELAAALRVRIAPELGRHSGRAHAGAGEGGDVTFAIDEDAEAFTEEYLAEHAPEVALYSEDRGLLSPGGDARWVLVVDPIDGTRPAMAGFESACVSVALAPLAAEPTMGEVVAGCVIEIKSGQGFYAERGGGLDPAPSLSPNRDLGRMFWAYGLRGRPVRAIAEVLGELIDVSSVGGGTFDLGSATYDMTRIATGQLDAYLEPGPRIVADVPGMRAEFERVGGGRVLNNSPYDLAAAVLLLDEGGAVVTDAYGESLSDRPLLGSGADYQMSCVAAANQDLHSQIITEIDRGIERLLSRA
jgi:myo-inositol-1(or 4)-monophosphatase